MKKIALISSLLMLFSATFSAPVLASGPEYIQVEDVDAEDEQRLVPDQNDPWFCAEHPIICGLAALLAAGGGTLALKPTWRKSAFNTANRLWDGFSKWITGCCKKAPAPAKKVIAPIVKAVAPKVDLAAAFKRVDGMFQTLVSEKIFSMPKDDMVTVLVDAAIGKQDFKAGQAVNFIKIQAAMDAAAKLIR